MTLARRTRLRLRARRCRPPQPPFAAPACDWNDRAGRRPSPRCAPARVARRVAPRRARRFRPRARCALPCAGSPMPVRPRPASRPLRTASWTTRRLRSLALVLPFCIAAMTATVISDALPTWALGPEAVGGGQRVAAGNVRRRICRTSATCPDTDPRSPDTVAFRAAFFASRIFTVPLILKDGDICPGFDRFRVTAGRCSQGLSPPGYPPVLVVQKFVVAMPVSVLPRR